MADNMKSFTLRRFTLIELLVVVAIVAVIGAGVAATYGRELVEDVKRRMTLHEMGQIREAFERFYSDNAAQMLDGLTEADGTSLLPDTFSSKFIATDENTYAPATSARPQRLYGVIEFFERYGLWPLFQKSVQNPVDNEPAQIFHSAQADRRVAFNEPSFTGGEGWCGPYLDAVKRISCVENVSGGHLPEMAFPHSTGDKGVTSGDSIASSAIRFPQPATKYDDGGNGGFYRILYFEHCEEESAGATVYRRLLLFAAEHPLDYDTWEELRVFAGNRRYSGGDAVLPIDLNTGAVKVYDASCGVFFIELLNMDIQWR